MITFGQEFIGAEAKNGGDYRTEKSGGQTLKIVHVELKDGSIFSDGKTRILFVFDIAKGPNAGIYKEITEKFGKEDYPWIKYLSKMYELSGDDVGYLRGLIETIANDPENAAQAAAIGQSLATGSFDESLLIGRVVGTKLKWVKNKQGYYNLYTTAWMTSADAEKIGIDKNPEKPADNGGGSGTGAVGTPDHAGNQWT